MIEKWRKIAYCDLWIVRVLVTGVQCVTVEIAFKVEPAHDRGKRMVYCDDGRSVPSRYALCS